jgi:hypothetical protein
MKAFLRHHRYALSLSIAVCLIAAGAVYADLEIGYYAPENLGGLTQPAAMPQRVDAAYRISAFPLYKPELAPGPGRQDVEAYCNTCHSPNYILMQPPLPAATWEAEVTKMGKAFGAQIPPESQDSIVKYLQAHYTPETRKH